MVRERHPITYHSRDSQVRGGVRSSNVTLPSILVVGSSIAIVGVRAVCPRPVLRGEVPTQAVLLVVGDTPARIKPQGGVRKRAVDNTPVTLTATAAKTEVPGAPDTGILDGPGVRVPLLVPVGLGSGVVALLLQEDLVGAHVVPVPREELSNTVDIVGLDNVCPLELVPSVLGAVDVELSWLGHQTFLSTKILGLLIVGKSVPCVRDV